MLDSEQAVINGITIDDVKINVLLRWLIVVEKNNVKTKEMNDQQMIATIQKKIEEVVKCY